MSLKTTLLRTPALMAVLIGALGSVGLTLYAGRHNSSRLLIAIFVIWVLSPFVALLLADAFLSPGAMFYGLSLVIALGTLAIYGAVALGPPRTKTATVFVIVPPASWLLVAAALIAGRLSRKVPPR